MKANFRMPNKRNICEYQVMNALTDSLLPIGDFKVTIGKPYYLRKLTKEETEDGKFSYAIACAIGNEYKTLFGYQTVWYDEKKVTSNFIKRVFNL